MGREFPIGKIAGRNESEPVSSHENKLKPPTSRNYSKLQDIHQTPVATTGHAQRKAWSTNDQSTNDQWMSRALSRALGGTSQMYEDYLARLGWGRVCEVDEKIVGVGEPGLNSCGFFGGGQGNIFLNCTAVSAKHALDFMVGEVDL